MIEQCKIKSKCKSIDEALEHDEHSLDDEDYEVMDKEKLCEMLEIEVESSDEEDLDAADNNTYLDGNGKFGVLNKYFGISSLPIPPCAGNERKAKKSIKNFKRMGAVISGDFNRLCHIINQLKSPGENKKNNKEVEDLLVPLLSEKVFFKIKYPMSTEDLIEVCNVSKYECHEAGTTLYK